jgi:hypothetical protein
MNNEFFENKLNDAISNIIENYSLPKGAEIIGVLSVSNYSENDQYSYNYGGGRNKNRHRRQREQEAAAAAAAAAAASKPFNAVKSIGTLSSRAATAKMLKAVATDSPREAKLLKAEDSLCKSSECTRSLKATMLEAVEPAPPRKSPTQSEWRESIDLDTLEMRRGYIYDAVFGDLTVKNSRSLQELAAEIESVLNRTEKFTDDNRYTFEVKLAEVLDPNGFGGNALIFVRIDKKNRSIKKEELFHFTVHPFLGRSKLNANIKRLLKRDKPRRPYQIGDALPGPEQSDTGVVHFVHHTGKDKLTGRYTGAIAGGRLIFCSLRLFEKLGDESFLQIASEIPKSVSGDSFAQRYGPTIVDVINRYLMRRKIIKAIIRPPTGNTSGSNGKDNGNGAGGRETNSRKGGNKTYNRHRRIKTRGRKTRKNRK